MNLALSLRLIYGFLGCMALDLPAFCALILHLS
jgi:hypothetical protein